MKHRNTIFKSILAMVLALGVSVTANAQLKGVLNKTKKAVKEKVEKTVEKKVDEVVDQALGTSSTTTSKENEASKVTETLKTEIGNKTSVGQVAEKTVAISSGPEIPELMAMKQAYNDYDETGNYINSLAWGLRKMPKSEAKALAAKLTARAKWCAETLSQLKEGGNFELRAQLNKELQNWAYFYSKMGSIISLMNHTHFKKDENGFFYYEGDPMYMCGIHVSGNEASQEGVAGRKTTLIFTRKDGKSFFCSATYEPKFAEEDDIRVAKLDYNMASNITTLFEGYPLEWCRANGRGLSKDDYDIYYQKALSYVSVLDAAIKGNSLDNLDFKPIPKAGSMNASMKAKALSVQKAKNKSVIDVVITSNSWDVKKNALGVPIRRIISGYSIIQTKYGKMATNVSWSEEYEGGKYGSLRAYGVGMESFYVK